MREGPEGRTDGEIEVARPSTEVMVPSAGLIDRLKRGPLSPLVRRAKRTLRGDPSNASICFVHMPKCGGESMHDALRRPFALYHQPVHRLNIGHVARAAELAGRDMIDLCRDLLLFQLASQKKGYIGGHYAFSASAWTEFHGHWKFITVLRDPVKRWFSHYFYNRYKAHSELDRITEELEQFIETERAVIYGSMYVRHLSASGEVAEALANLDRFDLVGTLERLPDFAERFQRMFGTPLSVGRRNENPLGAERQREMITPELRARVEELCEPDMRVYEHAAGLAPSLVSSTTTL